MSRPSDAPAVLVEQRDRILLITINRPEAKNAINAAVSHGLADAMDRLDEDPGLSRRGWPSCSTHDGSRRPDCHL